MQFSTSCTQHMLLSAVYMMWLLHVLQAASGAKVTVWSTPQWINELDTALQVRIWAQF